LIKGKTIYYPNPGIEMRIRVQKLGAYSESEKHQVTLLALLVMRCFLGLLDGPRDCAINVFSISGLGY